MKLTDYFIKKKVHSLAIEAKSRKHESCALENANQILVLCEAGDQETLHPLLGQLRKMKKNVHSCVFVSEKEVPEQSPSELLVHAHKDLTAWHVPSDSVLKQFQTLPADILIDLTQTTNYPMKYLLLKHTCPYKVGVKHPDMELYDLSISVTAREDIKQIFEHILFYLQAIRSK